MVGAQVEQIVAGQCGGAVEAGLARAVLQFLETLDRQVFGIEQPQRFAQGFVLHAESFEQAHRVIVIAGLGIVGGQRRQQGGIGRRRSPTAEFEQMVAAAGDDLGQFAVRLLGARDQVLQRGLARFRILLRELHKFSAEAAQQFAAIRHHLREGIEAFVMPAQQGLLRAVGDGREMQLHVAALADAVEAADALFQHVRG